MIKVNQSFRLEIYQELADLSSEILDHLQAQHWCRAANLCLTYEQTLEKIHDHPALTRTERQMRRSLLNQILSNDAKMRSLMSPYLGGLLTMTQSVGSEQSHHHPLFN